jgi:hypothetical protein
LQQGIGFKFGGALYLPDWPGKKVEVKPESIGIFVAQAGVTYLVSLQSNPLMFDNAKLSESNNFTGVQKYNKQIQTTSGGQINLSNFTASIGDAANIYEVAVNNNNTASTELAYIDDKPNGTFVYIKATGGYLNIIDRKGGPPSNTSQTSTNGNGLIQLLDGESASFVKVNGVWELVAAGVPALRQANANLGQITTLLTTKAEKGQNSLFDLSSLGFQNGWGASSSGGYDTPTYHVDNFNRVSLQGKIAGGSDGATVVNIPSNLQPTGYSAFIAASSTSGGYNMVAVNALGDLKVYYNNFSGSSETYLDGITWLKG